MSRDDPLVPTEATEHMLVGVVGGREIGLVVPREDLCAEVVGGARHVLQSRAANGRAGALGGGTDVLQDGLERGSGLPGARGASEHAGRAAHDAMEERDVVRLVARRLYRASEVLSELAGEQRGVFFSASCSVRATSAMSWRVSRPGASSG